MIGYGRLKKGELTIAQLKDEIFKKTGNKPWTKSWRRDDFVDYFNKIKKVSKFPKVKKQSLSLLKKVEKSKVDMSIPKIHIPQSISGIVYNDPKQSLQDELFKKFGNKNTEAIKSLYEKSIPEFIEPKVISKKLKYFDEEKEFAKFKNKDYLNQDLLLKKFPPKEPLFFKPKPIPLLYEGLVEIPKKIPSQQELYQKFKGSNNAKFKNPAILPLYYPELEKGNIKITKQDEEIIKFLDTLKDNLPKWKVVRIIAQEVFKNIPIKYMLDAASNADIPFSSSLKNKSRKEVLEYFKILDAKNEVVQLRYIIQKYKNQLLDKKSILTYLQNRMLDFPSNISGTQLMKEIKLQLADLEEFILEKDIEY
jgi:hypothetical protein